MRSAGMLRVRTGTICLLVLTIGLACGLPLQFLPSIPGYIPVYIRNGDEPLININPALAEAFHETENYSKAARNMQLDRILEEALPKNEGKIGDEKGSRKPLGKVTGRNLEDSQSNDAINKIIDPTPHFVDVYKLKEIKDENGNTNTLKISNIPEEEKNVLKALAAEIEKEETRANDAYDSLKISSEPDEAQFIRVSVVNDPLDAPFIRRVKNVQISGEDDKELSKKGDKIESKTDNSRNVPVSDPKILEKIEDDDVKPREKDLFHIDIDTRLKDLAEKNNDALIN